MSVCVLHPNFGCLIQHCALFCQNASRVYASGPGPWEVSPASSGTLQIMTPSIHVSLCLEDFSPQTSPSGTNYPMVGVLSMCPPHQFSQIPTSGHPCGPAQTRFFAYLALHGLHTTLCTLPHTSAHLCAPLPTSAHLHTPFRTPLSTSLHLHAP